MNMRSQPPAYDAFGDRAATGRSSLAVSSRARNAAVAIFWSVAMLLVAGRVYQHEAPQAHTMELASR